jgi:hypothetical protein
LKKVGRGLVFLNLHALGYPKPKTKPFLPSSTLGSTRYYNTERRQLKFKMARGQISELEVLISCAFVKNWAYHIWAPWRNKNSILNFKKVARNDKMDHICYDIICVMYFGSFGRILEHFVNFLKWPEKKFEVIFRFIFRPLFLFLLYDVRYIWRIFPL